MSPVDLIIHAGWIIPVEPDHLVLEKHALVVSAGKIIAILPSTEASTRYSAKVTQTKPNHLLLPGFVNAHAHSPMTLLRGLADDLALMDWLENHIWPVEKQHLGPDFMRDGSLIAMGEMIKSGTTCFNEHYFFPDISAECVAESGLRATVGLMVFTGATAWANGEEEAFNKGLAVIKETPSTSLMSWAWAPHSPYMNSDAFLKRMNTHALEHAMPIHMHVHESRQEIERSMSAHQQRPLARLEQLGLMHPRMINVHMTQLLPDEIKMVADTGAHVIHCPASNLKLNSGYCEVQKLIKAGVNVGLATDGAASNNNLDMLAEMRLAALIGKTVADDPTAVNAMSALKMATINGAKALGLDQITGSLVAGKAADMIAIDMTHLNTQPLHQPISQLVYAANSQQITDVWVAGKPLLQARSLTTLNEANLQAAAHKWQQTLNPGASS